MEEEHKIHSLEENLGNSKEDVRQDFQAIKEKVAQTKDQLDPTKIVAERVFFLSAETFAVGFALGYRDVSVAEFAKPAAKAAFASAGRQAGVQLVKRSLWRP